MANGRWRGSTRRGRLPADWPQIRREVLDRHGGRCHVCGHGGATDVDHVARGDDHRPANLRPICGRRCRACLEAGRTPCHAAKSSAEGGTAAQAARPRRNRPAEQHPGLR